jgi:hypothetical protein
MLGRSCPVEFICSIRIFVAFLQTSTGIGYFRSQLVSGASWFQEPVAIRRRLDVGGGSDSDKNSFPEVISATG